MVVPIVYTAQLPSRMTFFEVHALHDDRWMIDGAAESRDDALEDAAFMLRRPGIAAVKVIKETFDHRTDLCASRVIFERRKPAARAVRSLSRAAHGPASGSRVAEPPVDRKQLEKLLPPAAADTDSGWNLFAGLSLISGIAGTLLFLTFQIVA